MAGAGLGVADVFSVANNTTTDVVPPSGESWMVVSLKSPLGTGCELYDGTTLVSVWITANSAMPVNGTVGYAQRFIIDNSDYLRFNGTSAGGASNCYYGAVRI